VEKGTSAAFESSEMFPDSIDRFEVVFKVVWQTKCGIFLSGSKGPKTGSS